MSFVLSDVGPCKKRAEIKLDIPDVQHGFDSVYEDICDNISFHGFRKGRVPRELVARKHGKDIIGDVREKLIRDSLSEMLKQEKLEIISQIRFDEKEKELQEGGDFSFTVSFEVKPSLELPDYKGLRLTKKIRKVGDAHLEDARNNHLRSLAVYEEAGSGEKLDEEDIAVLNLEARDENGDSVYHNNLFPYSPKRPFLDIFRVEDAWESLEGAQKGDKREFFHQTPEDFGRKDLAGKKLSLKVEVDSLRRLKIPEFGLEFVKSLGFDTEEAYRDKLREMLEKEFEKLGREELRLQIHDQLDEKVKGELPEETVSRHAEYLKNVKILQLIQSGMPREQAEAKAKDFQDDASAEARKEIKLGFVLSRIADEEKVFVTEREMSSRVVAIAAQRGLAPEKLRDELEKNQEMDSLRDQIKREKVIDLLIKKAEVSEEAVEETPAAKAEDKPAGKRKKK